MAQTATPSQLLAETLIGRPLEGYVLEKRAARPKWSWTLIAEQLAADTEGKVSVSAEALRVWYGESVGALIESGAVATIVVLPDASETRAAS